jgi:hypothetical protein
LIFVFRLEGVMRPEIVAVYNELSIDGVEFESGGWSRAVAHEIGHDWQDQPAPSALSTVARLLWNEREIVIGYECGYTELDVDEGADASVERHGLWDRDVCEAFIRSPLEPHDQSYREFEVAPTGQWCDLLVDRARMWHDWEWQSGMRTYARIDEPRSVWRVAMAIPFTAFGCQPQAGDRWQANLFRISRFDGCRRYLALSPTMTEIPNFHVAGAFLDLLFR